MRVVALPPVHRKQGPLPQTTEATNLLSGDLHSDFSVDTQDQALCETLKLSARPGCPLLLLIFKA